MADSWNILLEHSSLASGDAWEHLNAQEGGSGGIIPMPAYLTNVQNAVGAAFISNVTKRTINAVASLSSLVTAPTIKVPATLSVLNIVALRYPSRLSSMASFGSRGVAGISDITL